jgi:hypothetical protein
MTHTTVNYEKDTFKELITVSGITLQVKKDPKNTGFFIRTRGYGQTGEAYLSSCNESLAFNMILQAEKNREKYSAKKLSAEGLEKLRTALVVYLMNYRNCHPKEKID